VLTDFTEKAMIDPVPLILIVFWGAAALAFYLNWKSFRNEVEEHKTALLKGGLVKRRSSKVHKTAMSELGQEHPNRKLPHREYFD